MINLTQRQTSFLSLGVCILLVSVIFLPSILFFSFMLVPTIILIYYDTEPEHSKAKAVGSLNIVGTAHAVNYSLITYGNLSNISELLRDIINWVYPLGLTGVGLIIYHFLPTLIRNWMEFWFARKETLLKERQIKLVEDWGGKVKGKLETTDTELPANSLSL